MPDCTCKFVAPNLPMQNKGCPVHTKQQYACDCCDCNDYRPRRAPDFTKHPHYIWGNCACGHQAQDHN